jgi:transketolase
MTSDPTALANMANAIRALAMDAVQAAESGHPGMPMGMADVATVLWSRFLKFDPGAPKWADRDRFVLSAGHGSMLLYSLLHLSGYAQPTMDDIRDFRQLTSPCAGHPENFLLPGVECTTGPLGQGFAMAVGMAMAERHLNAQFGSDLVDHRTWVIAGDGCLMEGINHEAVGLAGTLGLGRLIVLWDNNKITIDGDTSLSTSEDILARYEASGWHTEDCDGHDFVDIERAIAAAMADGRPSLISCRTVIGKGAPTSRAATMSTVRRWARTRSPRPANIWAGARLPSRFRRRSWPTGAPRAMLAATSMPSGTRASLPRRRAPNSCAAWLASCPRARKRARPLPSGSKRARTSPRARLRSWRSKS